MRVVADRSSRHPHHQALRKSCPPRLSPSLHYFRCHIRRKIRLFLPHNSFAVLLVFGGTTTMACFRPITWLLGMNSRMHLGTIIFQRVLWKENLMSSWLSLKGLVRLSNIPKLLMVSVSTRAIMLTQMLRSVIAFAEDSIPSSRND